MLGQRDDNEPQATGGEDNRSKATGQEQRNNTLLLMRCEARGWRRLRYLPSVTQQ